MKIIRILTLIVLYIFTFLGAGNLGAEIIPDPKKSSYDLDNISELSSFMDGMVEDHLRSTHTAGATVSIVKDGKVIFAKGYGYADVQKRIPVEANKTLFRIASITKIYTAIAALQLVEQGKLDLDTDVNSYLQDFKVEKNFPGPITIRHLMTHTAGFGEAEIDKIIVDYKDGQHVNSILEDLKDYFPKQVRAPGKYSAYSNHGLVLLGRLIELASGMDYNDYIDQHILKPMKMKHTTSRQPVPEHMTKDLSVGYYGGKGPLKPGPFNLIVGTSAGSISSTASDMAKFMIMNLHLGQYEDETIISKETAEMMQARQFAHDPRVAGMTLQFVENFVNGERLLQHSGSIMRHLSQMILIPQHDIGFFISFNGPNVDDRQVVKQFMDRYFPYPEKTFKPLKDTTDRISQVKGSYISLRRGYGNFMEAALILGIGPIELEDMHDGTIGFRGERWMEIEPYIFENMIDSNRLVFILDNQGNISHLLISNSPTTAYEKVAGIQSPTLQGQIGLVLILILILTSILWLSRRFRNIFVPSTLRVFEKNAMSVSAIPGILLIFMVISIPMDPNILMNGFPEMMLLAFKLNYLFIPVLIAMLAITFIAWKQKYFPLFDRIRYSLITMTVMVAAWWLARWNLMG